jgi:hypothetical protein
VSRHEELREATAAATLRGEGRTPAELRQAIARGEPPEELRALVDKIRREPSSVTDDDLARLAPHRDEDELFEIIVAAALGIAGDKLQAAMRALDEADDKK